VALRVLGLEGLLETKRGVRLKDQADAALIERALEALRRADAVLWRRALRRSNGACASAAVWRGIE